MRRHNTPLLPTLVHCCKGHKPGQEVSWAVLKWAMSTEQISPRLSGDSDPNLGGWGVMWGRSAYKRVAFEHSQSFQMYPEFMGCRADPFVCFHVWVSRILRRKKCDMLQRWQWVISLCQLWFICVFICLRSVTETERRRHGDKLSLTGRAAGFVLWKPAPSFHFFPCVPSLICSSFPFISFLSPLAHLGADVGWGEGGCWWWGVDLGLFSSVCTPVCPVAVPSFWWGFKICGGWVCSF